VDPNCDTDDTQEYSGVGLFLDSKSELEQQRSERFYL
jgi:hypothetical protein